MKLFVITLSLILVLADQELQELPNGDTDYGEHIPPTIKPINYSDEIYDPDFADNPESTISFNYKQERTGQMPEIVARKENIRHFLRVRRPIKKRKIFHIRRGNWNNEPKAGSLQISDIIPLITETIPNEYPASNEMPKDDNPDDDYVNLPEIIEILKEREISSSQQTNDSNQQIDTTTNRAETRLTNSAFLVIPDFISETENRPRILYRSRQKLREPEEMDNVPELQVEIEDDSPILTTLLDFQESSTESSFEVDPIQSVPEENNIGINSNEQNDIQAITMASSYIDQYTTTENPSMPIMEVTVVSDVNQKQNLPQPRMRYRGRKKFKDNEINEMPREITPSQSIPVRTLETSITTNMLTKKLSIPRDDENAEKSNQQINLQPTITTEIIEYISTTQEAAPMLHFKPPQLMPNIESTKTETNNRSLNDFTTSVDQYYVEEIIPTTRKIVTMTTAPLTELAAVSNTEKTPRLRRRRRRKFRKRKILNNTPKEASKHTTPQQTVEESTMKTMSTLVRSTELGEPLGDHFDDNTKKQDVILSESTTAAESTTTAPTTFLNSHIGVPNIEDNFKLPRTRYRARPKFRKSNRVNNIPQSTKNISGIENASNSTASESGSPFTHYRGTQTFRKWNRRNNIRKVINDNVSHSENVTPSTSQPITFVTESAINTASLPESSKDNAIYNMLKTERSNPFIRKRLRIRPTTANPEITYTIPATAASDVVFTDNKNYPQHPRIRHRNRLRRIKKRPQTTTTPSTLTSTAALVGAITPENKEGGLKTHSTPPPVPTLSPWSDGFGK